MAEILRKTALKEILLSAQDPIYFINHYCKTQHPTKGLIPLKLFDFQEKAVNSFLNCDRVIVNKARQLGYSTITAAFIAWLILFHNHKTVLVVATKADVAKNLIKKIKIILKHIPDWMYLADITTDAQHTVALSNGSWVKAIARSEDAGRSEALSLLVVDEAAHIEKMDELWTSLYSTVATGGKVLVLSTPKGINWFYYMYKAAENEENEWKALLTNWWEQPEYSLELREDLSVPGGFTSPWFKRFTEGMTEQQIRQELLTSFIDTGDTFFQPLTIQKWEKRIVDPIQKEFPDKALWIWRTPEHGRRYLISVDTAGGGAGGEDYSTLQIIELRNCEQVAEYKGKVSPDILADWVVQIATYYNNAYIVVENTGIGLSTALLIKKLDYKNLVYFDDNGRIINKYEAQYKQINPGFAMTPLVRPVVLSKLEEFLNRDYIKLYSRRFINEMFTFKVKNGKPQASNKANDDLIMAMAINIWVREACPNFGVEDITKDYLALYGAATITKNTLPSIMSNKTLNLSREREKAKEYVNQLQNMGIEQESDLIRKAFIYIK